MDEEPKIYDDRLYSCRQLEPLSGVSRRAIAKAIERGELSAYVVPGHNRPRVRGVDFKAWAWSMPHRPPQAAHSRGEQLAQRVG